MKRVSAFIITLSAVGLLAACREERHAKATAPRPVLSVVASPTTKWSVTFAGTIEPRYKSDLGFRVLGRIISRDVSVGDVVKKGQRLATLDPVALQLAVRSAEADLASATAQLDNAVGVESRQRVLLEQNTTTQAVFDAARQARESAQAGVARAKANLDKAREQLDYAELRAEFDGVVTAVQAELGQVVQPGQTVMSIARPDVREAVIDLPESNGRNLVPGTSFKVALQVDPRVLASGTVREIAPRADSSTRTLRVRISLDEPPKSFRLGTTITAAVDVAQPPGIELPASALLERDGRTMVWIVDPAAMTVSTRDVAVAERIGPSVRVVDGLAPGARVVTAGVHSLSPGQAIKVSDGALQ